MVIRRVKVCLLGASAGGKTSLIRSLMAMAPSLTHIDDRTIGIDRYKWTVFDADSHAHDVMFWDFAGQDVYQAAHTLFFSQRTLYLLCVDLSVYSQALLDHDKEPIALNRDAKTQRFVQYHVLRWAGMILARQPDASILVVGTKSDLLTQPEINRVSVDLHLRIESWFKDAWFALKGDERAHVPAVKTSLRNFNKSKMLVLNVKTDEAVRRARAAVEENILAATSIGIAMTPMHTQVLDVIERRRPAAPEPSVDGQVVTRFARATSEAFNQIIVEVEGFKDEMAKEFAGLTRAQCEQILVDLHDLGDLLWYRQEHLGSFRKAAILDPDLILDLVRELVNHTHMDKEGEKYDVVRKRGEVSHSLLIEQPHWKDIARMEPDYVLMFKQLMQDYELAYPLGPDDMSTTSDLIVPMYWKVKQQEKATISLLRSESVMSRDPLPQSHYGFWQYAVPIDVSEPIFDQFIVRSHSKHMSRSVTSTCVQSTKTGILTARVYYEVGAGKVDHIRIEVVASSDSMCWKTVRFFVLAMEVVLENYPGLKGVGRNILYRDPGAASPYQSFEVILAVKALQDERTFAMGDGYARRERPWLPPNLDWFADKVWRRPDAVKDLKDKEKEADRERQLQVMVRLGGSPQKNRLQPALWMLVVRDDHLDEAEVLLLSDLSGICYHKTWEVKLGSDFKAKYSKYVKAGVSVFSTVERRFLSGDIISVVLASARSALTNPVHSDVVSDLIGQVELDGGPSRTSTSAMLRDLLEIENDSKAVDKMEEAKLVCAKRRDSSGYIWASVDDFKRNSADVTRLTKGQVLDEIAKSTAKGSLSSSPPSILVHLQITNASGFQESDSENAWCSWEVVYKGSVMEHGETRRNMSSKSIRWTTQFTFRQIKTLRVLRECSLRVKVKRPSRAMFLPARTIAQGSQAFEKYVDVDRISSPLYLTVELGGNSAVACVLTIIGESK